MTTNEGKENLGGSRSGKRELKGQTMNLTEAAEIVRTPHTAAADGRWGVSGLKLEWECSDDVMLDDSIVFGHGYDFFGLECLRREATGPNGKYAMWPNNGKWSLYRDSDGMFAFERYVSREECEQAAEQWCDDVVDAVRAVTAMRLMGGE